MTGRIPNLARALILGSLFATVIAGQSAFADGPVVSVRSPGSADAAAPRPAATRVGSRVDLTGARQALAAPVATYAPGAIDLALSTVVGGLSSPLFVTNAGDGSGRLFVVEKAGKIKIVSGGVVTGTFLDIRAKVSKDGERGLLGLAFHPDYPTTGTFYVYYTDLKGKIALAVYHRSTGDPDKADPVGSVLLRISKPFSNHNGGTLAFGPDGYLYMGTGDGGSGGDPGNRAQNLKSLLGKLLRIDISGRTAARPYKIPSSNPYVGKVGYDQIWARGLRNPWRFSFDSLTGDLWIGDVGQDRCEEIDRSQAAGARSGQELWLAGHGGQGLLQPVVPLRQVRQEAAAGRLQSRQGLLGDRRVCLSWDGVPRPGRRLPVRRFLLGPDLVRRGRRGRRPDAAPVA